MKDVDRVRSGTGESGRLQLHDFVVNDFQLWTDHLAYLFADLAIGVTDQLFIYHLPNIASSLLVG